MKRTMAIITAILMLTALVCPTLAAYADAQPTSACVTNLVARYENGTLTVTADVTGIEDSELVCLKVYGDAADLTDSSAEIITFAPYTASVVVADGKLTIDRDYAPEKFVNKCVACIQVMNRGDGNDWVCAWIEAPVTLEPNFEGETAQSGWAVMGSSVSEWLAVNAVDVFTREKFNFDHWAKDTDGTEIGDDVVLPAGYTAYAAWKIRGLKGDMDFDGSVTVTDALIALRIASKLAVATDAELIVGDMDNDKAITVTDALAILRISAKLAPEEYLD